MARIVTSFNNFSRGKVDHDMMGRFDLPIYQTGSDIFQNCISNFKGNAIYRTGWESLLPFEDAAFTEFKFNSAQNYICVFYANKIRFLSYDSNGDFGWVLDGGMAILEVATPYSLAECKELQASQNGDYMVVAHPSHEPRRLIRVSANSFTFRTYARTDDPFATYQATKVITAITQAANALVSVAAHGYTIGQKVKFAAVVGMTQINGQTGTVVTTPTAGTFTVDIDTTAYTAYSSGGTTALILTSDYPACVLFYKGRLYYARTPLKPTTVFGSKSGFYDTFTLTPVDDASALIFTIADISQPIEWLFGGDNSLIAGSNDGIVAINGGGVGNSITAATVEATLTSAEGCNSSYPVRKDGLIFYVGRDGRNLYYFSYDLLTESFVSKDANFISYDITVGGIGKIRSKKDRNDLIFGLRSGGDMLTVNFKGDENVIGWHDHVTEGTFSDIAVITDNNGDPQVFSLTARNGTYYIERQGKYVEFVQRTAFFTGKNNKSIDTMAHKRKVAEQLKECIYLDNAQIVQNLQSNLITYDEPTGTITDTNGVFVVGDVGKSIVYKTDTGYESGRFEITAYTNANTVEVSVIQSPTSETYTDWYLTFSTISGLTDYNDTIIGVVTDGGYLSDYFISDGTVDLGKQVTHAVVGYRYKGVVKSFCLGFQIRAENTQITQKAISEVDMRFVSSAGVQIGSDLYRMEDVQELTPDTLNYLPPLPMDNTKAVIYSDDHEKDKFFYIVQDLPLPMVCCAAMIMTDYAVTK